MAAPGPWAQAVNGRLRRVPAWTIYLLGAAWGAWLFAGNVGAVDPVKAIEHAYGLAALQLVVATLAVTPVRRFAGLNLLKFRRALGLLAFFFVLAHFLVWAVLDVQTPGAVWADIVKRPFVTVGMAAFVLLIPLALSSNNASVRRLGGEAWRRLHWLTYPIAVLGAVHFIWLTRSDAVEPIVYLGLVLALLATRLPWRRAVRA